jgi:hypothetical protein
MSEPNESAHTIFQHITQSRRRVICQGRTMVLKLSSGSVPQHETIRFLDRVAEATVKATGLPVLLMIG